MSAAAAAAAAAAAVAAAAAAAAASAAAHNAEKLNPHIKAEELDEVVTKTWRGLSEPSRYTIFRYLYDNGPRNVHEVAEALGLNPSNTSRHLKVLYEAGLLTKEDHAQAVVYDVKDKPGSKSGK